MLVHLRAKPAGVDLGPIKEHLLTQFNLDREGFYPGGPLIPLEELDCGGGLIESHPRGEWLTLNYSQSFYGRGYERGNIQLQAQIAEWLERNIPGAEIWYGHDSDDESIKPFNAASRADILAYYGEVGHEPYKARRS